MMWNEAAVFDLDGTLVRGTSAERLLVPWLVRRGVVGWPQLAAAIGGLARFPGRGATFALRRNKRWLAGVRVERVVESLEPFLDEVLMPRICPVVSSRLIEEQSRGARTWLLTGAPDFVGRAVASRLNMVGAVATGLEIQNGRFTGEISGRHVFAAAKRDALHDLAREHAVDLAASSGYADHGSDVHFLECFGRAVAVRPDRRLARTARERGWEVLT
jgi:HAD superfamily hydrolase (TIGR01490 family)